MKKVLKIGAVLLAAVCVLGGSTALGLSHHVKASAGGRTLTPESPPPQGLDCVLVLGCGLKPDGSPSNMLEDRLKIAVELYKAGWADKILMTGDGVSREGYDEVATMTAFALDKGVPEQAILRDPAGLTTYDSLYRARDLYGLHTMVVVTQEYHLYRALYLADALGLDAVGVASDLRPYRAQVYREVREVFARDKAVIWARRLPEPAVTDLV